MSTCLISFLDCYYYYNQHYFLPLLCARYYVHSTILLSAKYNLNVYQIKRTSPPSVAKPGSKAIATKGEGTNEK